MATSGPLLRTKLLQWLLVPLIALLALDALVSYFAAVRLSQRAYDQSLAEIARELALHVAEREGHVVFDLPEPAQQVLLTDPSDTLYFRVVAADGRSLAGDERLGQPPPFPEGGRGQAVFDASIDGVPVRVAAREVLRPGGSMPLATIVVAETGNKRSELAREILLSVLAPQLLLIVIAGLLVWNGVQRGLAPLEALRQAIASRSHVDLRPLPEGGIPGEVQPLVHAMNGLMHRLDHALTLQSRFIADAAHQLKTPVAGLRAQLELMQRESDPQRLREALSRQYVGVERLARLVSQLLSLARNEPEALRTVQLQPVDLNALALEATMDWVPEALKKDIDLGFEGLNGPLVIHGDPARLRELFDNLLDNAIRYSRQGGRVTVRVHDQPRPTVAIHDDGPRIPVEERWRVFERFHRLLGSDADGSGLGLAIAQEIARSHGAEISLTEDADGVGNIFSVSFNAPISSESS
ncbi:MAG: sensor histidine kinase N-terminal domain-containing protein [Pseudomonadota bacterium]